MQEQDAAVSAYDHPKVVVATNVAETSLTIQGIELVIDSRFGSHCPLRSLSRHEHLARRKNQPGLSRSTRGSSRAHGTRDLHASLGEREHEQRLSVELPEVKRLDLSEVILTLKAAGIKILASFKWLEAPDTQRLKDALRLLTDLGALDAHQAMTSLGKQMLAFPLTHATQECCLQHRSWDASIKQLWLRL